MTHKLISSSPTLMALGRIFGNSVLSDPPLVTPSAGMAVEADKEDACAYLFTLCQRLDRDYLQPRGITCLFDVKGGSLRASCCHAMGLIIASLVVDIAVSAKTAANNGVIAITVQRWGSIWAFSVADSDIQWNASGPPALSEFIEQLANKINAGVQHKTTEDGTTVAFMFDPLGRPDSLA